MDRNGGQLVTARPSHTSEVEPESDVSSESMEAVERSSEANHGSKGKDQRGEDEGHKGKGKGKHDIQRLMIDRAFADYICVICHSQWMQERAGDGGVPRCPVSGCGGAGSELNW